LFFIDKIFKTELEECIKEYYTTKADGEVLNCYNYDPLRDKINAHYFIVGFQNLCNKKYPKFIDKTDVNGLSLFFKLYKALYGSYNNTFVSKNVNDFKEKVLVEVVLEFVSSGKIEMIFLMVEVRTPAKTQDRSQIGGYLKRRFCFPSQQPAAGRNGVVDEGGRGAAVVLGARRGGRADHVALRVRLADEGQLEDREEYRS
jgi:hypothetical protein